MPDNYQPVSSAARQAWIDGEDDPNELRSIDLDNGVSDSRRYQMYSPEANGAVSTAVKELTDAGLAGQYTRKELPARAKAMQRQLAATYGEVHDTEPEWAIVDTVNEMCDELGWVRITRDDLF